MGVGVGRQSSNFYDFILFIPSILKLKVIGFLS